MEFKELIGALNKVNLELKEQSIRAVNSSLTLRNWFFGFYIVEFEQNGNDRAEYGKTLLPNIAKELSKLKIPNTDERELRRYRQFYLTYPAIAHILSKTDDFHEFSGSLFHDTNIEKSLNQIRGTLSPEFGSSNIEIISNQIRESSTPETQSSNIEIIANQIRGTASPELNIPDIHYVNLLKRVSYSHFVEFISIENHLKRLFYEIECIKGTWSLRELKRQIGSLLYERTGLSGNKEKLIALTHQNSDIQSVPDFIRDPYVFEFIGLKPHEVILEKDLEQALIDHLLQFLLELGKGFCFESRQKRILIDNKHYYVDLVFYHRILHCNVLIDLKTERFHHSHASQLNLYLEYYKKYETRAGDNPPIGILLCTDKDQEHVEFATAGMDKNVFISQYLVALPNKHELEQFLNRELSAIISQNEDKKY